MLVNHYTYNSDCYCKYCDDLLNHKNTKKHDARIIINNSMFLLCDECHEIRLELAEIYS